jgi:hypothetical protein
MGGESKKHETFKQNSKTMPWEDTAESLRRVAQGVNGQLDTAGLGPAEQDAYAELESNARAGNPYRPQIGLLAGDLLSGGNDRTGMVENAAKEFRDAMQLYASLEIDPYKNQAFDTAVGYMSADALDKVKSSYAGAGMSPAGVGDFARSVGEGIARGVAPTWLQANNDLETRKLAAIDALRNNVNTSAGLLAGMDQATLANRRAGIDAATAALRAKDSSAARLLELAQNKWMTPMQRLAAASDMIVPMARAFGTTNTEGQRDTTSEMSPSEQAWGWMNAFANLGRGLLGGGESRGGGGGGWSMNG